MFGMLFLDDSRVKNFTSAYKDVEFLNFFYKQLRLNETGRFEESFPYVSLCGRERNFLRCDDRPIVFTEIQDDGTMLRIGQSSRTYPFEPTSLSMLKNGRLYHNAPFGEYGLIKSKTADELFPLFTFDEHGFPVDILWMSAPGAPKKSRRSLESISQDDVVEPVDVFCVEPSDPSISKNENDYFVETFRIINDHGIGAVWLSEEKALEVSFNDHTFYFVAVFRGRVFEHLKKIGVNLYGAHVVRQTLNAGGSLPRWDFPVYALNLTGACVCFTGLSLQKREELKAKINYMNGLVSPSLTEKVTHLVTEYCDTASRKYTETRRMGLPIMSPLWIDKAWEAAQAFSLDNFVSNEATQQYRLPIFSKMVITATGVGGSERMDIARLIHLNGGRFSGDMKRNECTHLIADQTKGVKYKKAREWNTIKIVRSSWLRKSVIAGYVLPESAFDPERRNRCSTPVLDSKIPEHDELEYSSISGKGGRLDNSTFNTQISKHDDEVDCERSPLTVMRPNFRRESLRNRRALLKSSIFDPIDHLEETFSKDDFDFLEGCRIWLCGADQIRLDKWKRILDRSGATRVANIEAASHAVVVNVPSSERTRLIQAQSRGVHVIRAEWVVACFQQKEQVPLKEYLWDPNDNVSQSISSSTSAKRPEEISNLLDNEQTPVSRTATNSKDLGPSDYLNLTPLCNASNDPDLFNLFRPFVFRLHGLTPDIEFQLRKELRSAGGKVVSSEDECTHVNYLICDQVEFGHVELKGHFDEAVTVFGRPFPAVEGSTVFSSTVVVVSCFGEYERLTLSNLIKRFGGRVQETLTRKGQRDELAVTHVIGGGEGARVIEARRQRFKVVDPSWVLESIINDKLMKEDQFPLEREAYASYRGRKDDLWPVAARAEENAFPRDISQTVLHPKNLREEFSDVFVEGFQGDGDGNESSLHRECSARFVEENVTCENAREILTPLYSNPLHLHNAEPNDRTLDMKKPFKANFRGLSQVMPSPVSSNSDISTDSLSTSAVGRILKEAATKTAVFQRRSNSFQPISHPTEASASVISSEQITGCRRTTRKSNSTKASVVSPKKVAPLHDDDPPMRSENDMMALRARMTERLEQRNREIG
ncbi:hypothetical protein KIN20_023122 [Parelaphostrongylus tenuis]|uniref:BRCT domain-containing protein n=1 Tax=Parelaphostrongylus tenuis TaxID=148309 RepID=A0AAD5N8P4_PARTN|nr:hypothetical protein KIN20_023122 [Parelaphostrongylus tenuis]